MMLGHSTPNLTSSYVTFSKDEVHRMTRLYMDRESSRKTSARNSFFGKVHTIRTGDIQSHVTLTTLGGDSISTMITNDSLERLGIKTGSLVSAEIKAPWVILQKNNEKPRCSADNILKGVVTRIHKGRVNAEYAARIEDGTEMCSIVASGGADNLGLDVGDPVWILFNCYAVVIHVD
jgi:molybdate transport system regulatory protein